MCDYKLVGKDEVNEMMGCSDQMTYKVIWSAQITLIQ